MPVVEQMLREITGHEPSRDLKPERAVSEGAAIHAAILQARFGDGTSKVADAVQKRLNSVRTSDVNSHSLGIKITDPSDRSRKINHIMIPKNTTIPFERTQRFVTNSDNQQRIHVSDLEGDPPDPMACEQIGDFRIYDLPPNLPKGSPVEVTYRYDSAGRIHVTAKELVGNTEAATEIVRENLGGTEENIDVMTGLAQQYEVE